MTVCVVAPAAGWRGGIHQYSAHLANSLADRVAVEVVGYRRLFPLWLYPGRSKRVAGEVALRPTIGVHPVLAYSSPWSALRAARLIAERIRPRVVDVQWLAPLHGLVLAPLMARLRDRAGVPVVLTVHNVVPHERRPFDTVLSRRAFAAAERLVVHAAALKGELVRRFRVDPARVAVVPHAPCAAAECALTPAEARARLGIDGERVVLFFGFVRPYKGLDQLLAAFRTVVAAVPDVVLVIAGEFFRGLDACRRELARTGLARHTHLVPRYIPYDEVGLFFRAADVVVQPYVRFAGQSGVTQTAYLHAVPVVATDVGGLAELVLDGKTGLVVPPRDPDALARALVALLTDEARRREYGLAGRRFLVEELAWDRTVERLLELYAAVAPAP